jgi:hypothetical protein
VSNALYEAGFREYKLSLVLIAMPVPPIPRLLKEPDLSRVPRLNLDRGELKYLCAESETGIVDITIIDKRIISLFRIVL